MRYQTALRPESLFPLWEMPVLAPWSKGSKKEQTGKIRRSGRPVPE
jgi:hypothetical protein